MALRAERPELQPLATIPTDGTWVHVIRPILHVGVGIEPYFTYEAAVIARYRSLYNSPGYWRTFYGSSIPDSALAGDGWWFPTGIQQKCGVQVEGGLPNG